MEPAYIQPFSIKVLERAVAIFSAGHAAVFHMLAKTKSPAWMLVTSGSAIIYSLMNGLFDRTIQVEQW